MAQLVVSVAAAAAGFAIGGPTGAQIGFALGSTAYGVLNPQQVRGPRLEDLKATALEYGSSIAVLYGTGRLPGVVAWTSDKREIANTESGKGGPEVTNYTYQQDVIFLLCLAEGGKTLRRIWSNGKLVWSIGSDAEDETLIASESPPWQALEILTGADDQMPWSVYEAEVGAGNAPAYRGRLCAAITGLDLGASGYAPQLTFEVVDDPGRVFDAVQVWSLTSATALNIGTVASPPGPDVPVRLNQRYEYREYNSYIKATYSTYRQALEAALSNTGTFSQAGEDLLDFYYSGIVSITYTQTTVYEVHLVVATVRIISTGSVQNKDCNFGISYYKLPDRAFSASTGFEGQFVETIVEIDDPATDNQGNHAVICRGYSDSAVVVQQNDTNSQGKRILIKKAAANQYFVDTAPGANQFARLFVLRGNVVFFTQGGSQRIVKNGSAWSSSVAPDNGTNFTNLAVNEEFVFYTHSDISSGVQQIEVSLDISTLQTFAYPSAIGDGRNILFCDTAGALYCMQETNLWRRDFDAGAWVLEMDLAGTLFDSGKMLDPPSYEGGTLYAVQNHAPDGTTTDMRGIRSLRRLDDVPGTPLDEVVIDLCRRAGLAEADVDASALAEITVDSVPITQVTAARQVLETLMQAYSFTARESDGLTFVLRGAAPAATVPYIDMGASEGDPADNRLPITRASDVEIPAQVAITYANVNDDYQAGTEYSDRLTGAGNGVQTAQLPLGLTPQQAKRIADVRLLDAVLAATSIGPMGLATQWAALEPADVITAVDRDGSVFRVRIERISDGSGVRTLELALDDASVLTSDAVTDGTATGSTIVRRVSPTELQLLDIPILRDDDNNAGLYAALAPAGGGTWPGAAVFRGQADTGYTEQVRATDRTVMGKTLTALPAWSGSWVFDESGAVQVEVVGELQSYTRAAILDGLADAYLVGDEILFARTATLGDPGVYTLSGLLRGQLGTEWAMAGHAVGERVVRLQMRGLRRLPMETGQLGITYSWRAPTIGKSLSSGRLQELANTGEGLRPFAPVGLRVDGWSGQDLAITWQRRTRLTAAFVGAVGINVPLGEATEAYEVQVSSNVSRAPVLRTITTASPAAAYSAADQAADGFSAADTIYLRIQQRSQAVGLGHALDAEIGPEPAPPVVGEVSGSPLLYDHTGSDASVVVPVGMTRMLARMWGGGGGGGSQAPFGGTNAAAGGAGGYVEALIAVTAGETITVRVAGGGLHNDTGAAAAGGFGGGGAGRAGGNQSGGGGGGASSVLRGSTVLALAAGGGGGASTRTSGTGAPAGGLTGQSGGIGPSGTTGGGGGTQSAGGAAGAGTGAAATAGASLAGGNGGGPDGAGGGGGGGYFGGGGGGGNGAGGSGGGSGSGYVEPTALGVIHTAGAGTTPPNTHLSIYSAGIAAGGAQRTTGGHGRIALIFYAS